MLEFGRVLDVVASRATSAAGAARVRALRPTDARDWISAEHARVEAMRGIVAADGGWHPHATPAIEESLARLRVAGSVWTSHELLAGATLLGSSRRTREELTHERRRDITMPVLSDILGRLVSARRHETAIERAIDAEGLVRDEASADLRRIRRELRGSQGEIVQMLERMMARLEAHHRVPDMSVSVRNGRYVIPVRREGRGAVGGIVHDESATRGTVFVEPPAAIEAGNRIRELEADEARETHRILRQLTEDLRPLGEELGGSLDALIELDSLFARARYAEEFACVATAPAGAADGFAIRNGRHPLLLAAGGTVVPFDLEMTPGETTLLVSGPNTGGKTVLLKAIGLISLMSQSGVPAPVGAESRVAIFDDVFADIGDEQSIQASLSTFSAHLRNLGEILEAATDSSLVLMDELGAGTDPTEGAALGWAILEELTRRGAMSVATTHLGALKLLASEMPGVVNASLQFDEQALAPTYRLIKGIPGRSYGLGIARRLRFPTEVLTRAEERVPQGDREIATLVADLERREADLAERERAAEEQNARSQALLREVEGRERAVREAQRSLEREARRETRQYLLEARGEIERTIRELRGLAHADENAARDARRSVEALVEAQGRALAAVESEQERGAPDDAMTRELAAGDAVVIDTLGGRIGRVVELRDGSAVVTLGVMKLTVPTTSLRRAGPGEARTEDRVSLRGDLPEVTAQSEVDVRGMRVDEMEGVLLTALDAAIRAELRSLRIIHGKGTGALRQRAAEMLGSDRRVKAYRLGTWNEGGAGVTVAELA